MSFAIAIDGPAGAGKSTIAKDVARKLSFIYVDTGAMYRAMALHLMRRGVAPDDAAKVKEACENVDVRLSYEGKEQQVILNGENVSGLIRTEEVSAMTSKSAVNPDIRKKLVELQQKLAASTDVVMDGRDIGTCVLPDAPLKIYLTASVEERARRRYLQLKEKGEPADIEVIKADIEERDYRDQNREISPLKQADDAVFLDTSDMSIAEVIQAIVQLYESRKQG